MLPMAALRRFTLLPVPLLTSVSFHLSVGKIPFSGSACSGVLSVCRTIDPLRNYEVITASLGSLRAIEQIPSSNSSNSLLI
jgi:hypothetical protein